VTDQFARLLSALADRYAIERELGQGGMATVYLAQDRKLGRAVALKVLRPELAAALGGERFLREIEIAAKLAHPHILALHDCGEAGGLLYYTMPFVEGETLRDRLAREKQLPLEEALRITREVADALSYAHAQGLVHRDIKPENILFQAGHAVVSDFGIAKAIAVAGTARLTETGLAVGTPAYMSPEQAAGSQDVDGRSDLYSLGCVLYEMLSGETPYTGPTPQAILAKKLSEPLPRISVVRETVPPGVEAALARALARTPADRFRTTQDFAGALTDAGAEARVAGERRLRTSWRVRGWRGAAVATAVVLLGVAGWWGVQRLRPPSIDRLAVLPLASFTAESTQQYFVQGVHDALIFDLQQAGVSVVGRTSVQQYAHTEKPIRQIARELGVDGVIEGSVLRAGDSVEIALRLIDGRTEAPRWQKSYAGDVRNILTLYHGVTRSIAAEIRSTLSPQASVRLATARSVDPQAYDDYLKGQFHWQRLTPADLDQAYEYFQRALRRDSTYALAWVGISLVWAGRNQIGATAPSEAAPKQIAAARRAVELDSSLAEAQYTIALALTWQEWDWAGAGPAFRRAIEINPNYPDVRAFYSHYLHIMKRPREARAQMDSALALDPLNALFRGLNGVDLWIEGRPADAVGEFRKALDGGNAALGMNVVQALVQLGRPEEALAELRKLFAGDAEVLDGLSRGYAVGGSRGAMRRLAEISAARPSAVSGGPFVVADWYALAGDRDRTLEWLTRVVDVRDPNAPYIGVWPDFVFVHDDARFQALCRRIGLPR
jgi:TolB-like protein/tRNA A-37 threonylcarbamoyl transferase component Bud32